MNWQELKQRSLPYIAKITPYIEKSKEYGIKALDFTQKQIENTPIVLKTLAEYEAAILSKRLILIGYDASHDLAQDILLRSPIWSTIAWSDNATIRFYTPQLANDLARHLRFDTPVDMRIYFGGAETYRSTDIEAIKLWWKARCYDGIETVTSPETDPVVPADTTADPLHPNKS